jgi:hypothetical protein
MSGECHKCKHQADLENGIFSKMEFEATPCAKCQLIENSSYTLEFDAERGNALYRGSQTSDTKPQTDEALVPMSVLNEVVERLLILPPVLRDVVCWRFAGLKYRDIAVLQNVTMAAVEARHRRAMKGWPELKAMFQEKLVKQAKRKKSVTHGE